jgi:large subunit ribosomal protein L29
MKSSEIRNLSENEIVQKVNDLEQEIFNLRFQSRTGKLDNPVKVRYLRRDVARLKTIARQKTAANAAPASK